MRFFNDAGIQLFLKDLEISLKKKKIGIKKWSRAPLLQIHFSKAQKTIK